MTAREDWNVLRRRFAAEALGNVLAFCGWQAGVAEHTGSCRALLLRTARGTRQLEVGPVELLWDGAPLTGAPPDWPGDISPEAARFLLTARPLASTVPLDLDLAARRDAGNPFYLACYTKRRLAALLTRSGLADDAAPLPDEGRALALAVDRFPAAVRRACTLGDPWPVHRCALALAESAQGFLHAGGRDRALLAAAEIALGNALGILLGTRVPGQDSGYVDRRTL